MKTEGVANNQYGVKVGQNLVVNPASDCGIVRSIYIKDSNINTVEVGWFEDDGTGGFHYKDCQDFANPHVLVYALIDNTPICKQDPQPVFASEPDYSFKVVNADHDSDFAYYYDDDDTPDTLLSVITTNHTNGYAQTATERQGSDSLRASFVPFNSLGALDDWHSYPDAFLTTNPPVGGWEVCSWSGLNLEVKSSC